MFGRWRGAFCRAGEGRGNQGERGVGRAGRVSSFYLLHRRWCPALARAPPPALSANPYKTTEIMRLLMFVCVCVCVCVQIAKAQGAFVATTCSGRNSDFVKKLGADRAIDYRKER